MSNEVESTYRNGALRAVSSDKNSVRVGVAKWSLTAVRMAPGSRLMAKSRSPWKMMGAKEAGLALRRHFLTT